MTDIREYLAHKPLLFDGGMGTYYKAAPGADCEMANLTDPEGVKKVHAEYLAAGAQAIKTNTFGLPRMAAAQMPGWEELAEAGWKLACDAAAEKDAAVFADLGPAPDTEAAPASSAYGLVAQQFAALGAKNFLFETLSSDVGIVEAVKALRVAVPDAFVMVSFAVLPDGYTREGLLFRDLLRRMEGSGVVDAVGLNCVSAPGAMKKLVRSLGETLLPLSVMPNAGYPVVTRARVLYQGKPAYFAREMGQIAAAGVRILGGCCGTTPAHIAALRAELDALPQQTEAAPAAKLSTRTAPAVEKDDAFLRKLNAGEKVIAIELDSPRVADLSGYLDGARRLQAAGADLLTIADCPIAQARMDSSLVACRVHRELGMCALPHMTCRDRNLNATKAVVIADSSSDYGKGLAKAFVETFTEGGGTIVSEESYVAKDTDFSATITKLTGMDFDVIFIPGYYEEVGLIIKTARAQGIDCPILGADGFDSPELINLAGADALNNIYFCNHYSSLSEDPTVTSFIEAFKAEYNAEPDAFNALGYDLAKFVCDAIGRADELTGEAVKTALENTENFTGVTGSFTIDECHNPVKSLVVISLENGEQASATNVSLD